MKMFITMNKNIKLIENIGFIFIRINPDVENFDLDVEIAKIYNYINESFVKLAVNLPKKSLKEKFTKELLNYQVFLNVWNLLDILL